MAPRKYGAVVTAEQLAGSGERRKPWWIMARYQNWSLAGYIDLWRAIAVSKREIDMLLVHGMDVA